MRNAARSGVKSAAIVVMISAVLGCGAPMGPIPGGTLEGPEAPWPEDWAFTRDIENVLLETKPEDPYSVTLWAVYVDDSFYVAGASSESRWVDNVLQQSEIRLAIEGTLYEGRASRVIDEGELRSVGDAYTTKYEIDTGESSTFIEDGGIIFRLSSR